MVNIIIRWLYSVVIGFIISPYVFVFGSMTLLFQDDPSILEKLPKIATLHQGEVEKIPRNIIKRNILLRIAMFYIGYFGGIFLMIGAFFASLFFGMDTSTKLLTSIPKLFYPVLVKEMLGIETQRKIPKASIYTEPISPEDSRVYNQPNSRVYNNPNSRVYDNPNSRIYNHPSNENSNQKKNQEKLITCGACGTSNQSGEFCMECGVKFSSVKSNEDPIK